MTSRRKFIQGAAVIPAAALATPALAQSTIKWRMQTYAGSALAAEVIVPAIEMFNKIAGDRMQIELFFADQLVPTGELFQAMQRGTIDAVQSDDDSMASPTDVTVFGGYFPFGSRYSCHFATKDPIRSLEDLKGKKIFTFPTAGRFLTQFGVVPVTLPWEDIEVALQTGELDGVAWSGITEDYTVGWADVTNYFLTNNISGAWAGSFFANMDRWNELPEDLQTLFRVCCDQSHYYRQWWYWGGEAALRVNGPKMELTTIPDEEWATVEAAAVDFWEEIAAESDVKRRVVDIFKKYNADMVKAGRPYRYG